LSIPKAWIPFLAFSTPSEILLFMPMTIKNDIYPQKVGIKDSSFLMGLTLIYKFKIVFLQI